MTSARTDYVDGRVPFFIFTRLYFLSLFLNWSFAVPSTIRKKFETVKVTEHYFRVKKIQRQLAKSGRIASPSGPSDESEMKGNSSLENRAKKNILKLHCVGLCFFILAFNRRESLCRDLKCNSLQIWDMCCVAPTTTQSHTRSISVLHMKFINEKHSRAEWMANICSQHYGRNV